VPPRKVDFRDGGRKIIAEIKRRSPSKGPLRVDIVARELALEYVRAGAAGISVLTDSKFFGGDLSDLMEVSRVTGEVPVLRKDFVIDELQVLESYHGGADMVLLIARALTGESLSRLIRACEGLGLTPLVEIHTEEELEGALESGARLIGVNNRDLDTFVVDLEVSRRLIPRIPEECVKVVESGISDPNVMSELEELGADAFLIGESLVTSPSPGEKLKFLIEYKSQ